MAACISGHAGSMQPQALGKLSRVKRGTSWGERPPGEARLGVCLESPLKSQFCCQGNRTDERIVQGRGGPGSNLLDGSGLAAPFWINLAIFLWLDTKMDVQDTKGVGCQAEQGSPQQLRISACSGGGGSMPRPCVGHLACYEPSYLPWLHSCPSLP